MVFALLQEKHQKIHRSHSVSVPPPGHPSCIVSVESASARWEQHAAAGDAQLWWFSGGTSHFQPRGFLGAKILEGNSSIFMGIFMLTYCHIMWLVVSTPLKNMKVSWGYSFQYMESQKNHVPNHQPVVSYWYFFWTLKVALSENNGPAGKPLKAVTMVRHHFSCEHDHDLGVHTSL